MKNLWNILAAMSAIVLVTVSILWFIGNSKPVAPAQEAFIPSFEQFCNGNGGVMVHNAAGMAGCQLKSNNVIPQDDP